MQVQKASILVVDDEMLVRKMVVRILKIEGYHVLEAANASEALSLGDSPSENIGVLVTDVQMPDMDGRQLAEKLCMLRPALRVVFMSGFAGSLSIPKKMGQKETAFIGKPFPPDQLLTVVEEALFETKRNK